MKKLLPWLLLALGAAYVLSGLRPPARINGFDLAAYGRLPVLLNGRIQPLESVGRNALLQIRARHSVRIPDRSAMQPAEWLLETLTQPEVADTRKIFRIDNGEVLSLLKLPETEKYFTFDQLEPHLDVLETQVDQVNKVENAQRTPYQRALVRLFSAIALHQRLKMSLIPPGVTNSYAAYLKEFQAATAPGMAAFQARQSGQPFDQAKLDAFIGPVQGFERVSRAAYPLLLPPLDAAKNRDEWANVGISVMQGLRSDKQHPALLAYAKMADAWRANKPEDFNQAVAEYSLWLQQNSLGNEVSKGKWEYGYQQFQGFYHSLVLYVGAFLLGIIGVLLIMASPGWAETLRRSSFMLVVLALVVHTLCLGYRMILEGRPPVTNLYSSAIFVGWAAVILCVIVEWLFRIGIANAAAALVGFVTLVIAHNLSLSGDTMEMMRAVLDDNFWLATHVVTITLGYSAMFVAGTIAWAYIVLALINNKTPVLSRMVGNFTLGKMLSTMVYGVLAFATLFSFVGTVLGGIWADQSWGRFWGWDPKENGALLITIWCVLYLHARWGKVFGEIGLMNIAIFGNVVTAWSWFGVNMLGVGLHSYGFMDKAFYGLMSYVVANGFFMLLGIVAAFRGPAAGILPPALPKDIAGPTAIKAAPDSLA